jgi:hypothetical protein
LALWHGRNHHRWNVRLTALSLEAADAIASDGDPGQSAELHEREIAVCTAIAALPPDLREALILSEYEIFLQSGQGCLPSKVFSTACVRDPVLEKSCTIFTQAIP